jgi:hypothetical protein
LGPYGLLFLPLRTPFLTRHLSLLVTLYLALLRTGYAYDHFYCSVHPRHRHCGKLVWLGTGAMIHLGSQAELHFNGAHLLLRTYFSDNRYAYTVQNIKGGMPVALCEERFKSAQAARRKAEEVAARGLGVEQVPVDWRPTKSLSLGESPLGLLSYL